MLESIAVARTSPVPLSKCWKAGMTPVTLAVIAVGRPSQEPWVSISAQSSTCWKCHLVKIETPRDICSECGWPDPAGLLGIQDTPILRSQCRKAAPLERSRPQSFTDANVATRRCPALLSPTRCSRQVEGLESRRQSVAFAPILQFRMQRWSECWKVGTPRLKEHRFWSVSGSRCNGASSPIPVSKGLPRG